MRDLEVNTGKSFSGSSNTKLQQRQICAEIFDKQMFIFKRTTESEKKIKFNPFAESCISAKKNKRNVNKYNKNVKLSGRWKFNSYYRYFIGGV